MTPKSTRFVAVYEVRAYFDRWLHSTYDTIRPRLRSLTPCR